MVVDHTTIMWVSKDQYNFIVNIDQAFAALFCAKHALPQPKILFGPNTESYSKQIPELVFFQPNLRFPDFKCFETIFMWMDTSKCVSEQYLIYLRLLEESANFGQSANLEAEVILLLASYKKALNSNMISPFYTQEKGIGIQSAQTISSNSYLDLMCMIFAVKHVKNCEIQHSSIQVGGHSCALLGEYCFSNYKHCTL